MTANYNRDVPRVIGDCYCYLFILFLNKVFWPVNSFQHVQTGSTDDRAYFNYILPSLFRASEVNMIAYCVSSASFDAGCSRVVGPQAKLLISYHSFKMDFYDPSLLKTNFSKAPFLSPWSYNNSRMIYINVEENQVLGFMWNQGLNHVHPPKPPNPFQKQLSPIWPPRHFLPNSVIWIRTLICINSLYANAKSLLITLFYHYIQSVLFKIQRFQIASRKISSTNFSSRNAESYTFHKSEL